MMTNCMMGCRNAKDWALLALRVAVGILFIYHGYGKLFGTNPGMTGFTGMLSMMHFPAPAAMAYVAALVEFVGGIAILLGIYAHCFAMLAAIVMLVAFAFAHKFDLNMGGAAFSLLASSVAIMLMGAGKFSVMSMMGGAEDTCCGADGACCHGDKKMNGKK